MNIKQHRINEAITTCKEFLADIQNKINQATSQDEKDKLNVAFAMWAKSLNEYENDFVKAAN